MKLKKLSVLIVIFCLFSAVTVYADYIKYQAPSVSSSCVKTTLNVSFPNEPSRVMNTVFCNGRLCIPLVDSINALGGVLEKDGSSFVITIDSKTIRVPVRSVDSNRCVMVYNNSVAYIYIYELIEPFGLIPIYDMSSNSVDIIKKDFDFTAVDMDTSFTQTAKKAFIRFEDITADGFDKYPKYTMENLQKFRVIAEYMYNNKQEFSIAWIPVYYNPMQGVYNDISQSVNLYNSYFIYVLDYMVDHGGHLGLHGYTHQYGLEKSADGYEWGKNTLYSFYDQQMRMIKAKTVCAKLGYKEEFFEFPHYGATDSQLRIAENYFDMIYQNYPSSSLQNYVTYTERSGKRVYYVPTPADYVLYAGSSERANAVERLKNCADNGYAVSIFFHPHIDFSYIGISDENGTRSYRYSNDADLPFMIRAIGEKGYTFGFYK